MVPFLPKGGVMSLPVLFCSAPSSSSSSSSPVLHSSHSPPCQFVTHGYFRRLHFVAHHAPPCLPLSVKVGVSQLSLLRVSVSKLTVNHLIVFRCLPSSGFQLLYFVSEVSLLRLKNMKSTCSLHLGPSPLVCWSGS